MWQVKPKYDQVKSDAVRETSYATIQLQEKEFISNVKLDQYPCVMTRTVNLPGVVNLSNVCICGQQ